MTDTDEKVYDAIKTLKSKTGAVNPSLKDIVEKIYGHDALNMETSATVAISLSHLTRTGKIVRHSSNPHSRYSLPKGAD